jgi:dTDP-4-dehydrorhamnose 3,5-epimerase
MKVLETGIPGLHVIEPAVFEDERGHFFETFSKEKLAAHGIDADVAQINHSFSKKGVLRGLHFQAPPAAQSKLVRCVRGSLYDVAVDIRTGSPTYGKWFGLELSAENKRMLYIPAGFAHGFYALTDCELNYCCGGAGYAKAAEGGLRYDCADTAIAWPLEGAPLVNERDRTYPTLATLASPFVYAAERASA